jgi:hypothetical protein
MDMIKRFTKDEELDQSLYAKKTIKKKDSSTQFFQNTIGQYKKEGELITQLDTNMCSSSHLYHLQFSCTGVRFKFSKVDVKIREYLMEYAYFIFRIMYTDFVVYPIHLMENHFYFVERMLTRPIIINECENFTIMLQMEEPSQYEFDMTCELVGTMRRSN